MRCPCVRLSLTFLHSVKTNKHIFKKFSTPGSHTILVFPYQTSWQYSDGDPLNVGVECSWSRQKLRSPPISGSTACCNALTLRQPSVINRTPFTVEKLWHLSLVVRGGVCWWRETTTKCLWQEVPGSQRYAKDNRTAFNCTQW